MDGIQDAGEPGIAGVLVTLLKCDGTPTGQSMNTSAAGLYLFQNLVPGCYKVQFATPAGLTPTLPNVGSDAADSDAVLGVSGNYTLVAGETNLTVDAGFYWSPRRPRAWSRRSTSRSTAIRQRPERPATSATSRRTA